MGATQVIGLRRSRGAIIEIPNMRRNVPYKLRADRVRVSFKV